MLNLNTVDDFIHGLEQQDTTLKNCLNLASLYIIREYATADATEKEINDILPSYRQYAKVKRKYASGEVTDEAVIESLHNLCIEITDLVKILYANTEMGKERREIGKMIENIQQIVT